MISVPLLMPRPPPGLREAFFRDGALLYVARGSLAAPITSVEVWLRTRQRDGVLLRAADHGQLFCLGLLESYLLVKMRNAAGLGLLAFTSEAAVSDGAWHHIRLAMAEPDRPSSAWHLSVDEQRDRGRSAGRVGGNLSFLNHSELSLAENFTGCLGEVRIGGVYLPLLGDPEGPQTARFSRRAVGREPAPGCRGDPVCESQPCLHQGVCHDHFNSFNCSCAPRLAGGAVRPGDRRVRLHALRLWHLPGPAGRTISAGASLATGAETAGKK